MSFILGCTATKPDPNNPNLTSEDAEALMAIGESLSGKEITQEDFKKQMKDKEAVSAVKNITESLSNPNTSIKYCPSTGKRYSGHLTHAEDCDVPLKPLEP